ncbi:FAD:protein FMN transferase [Amnibacterium endophyticum]|uniref:FAD:protein FMN transferase n=1 Tax=Amnibacterium endophyticum TaxID=2109337 RepID=A0ABW4LHV5_9MICO
MSVTGRAWQVWSTTAEVLVTDPAALDEACAIAAERIRLVGDACDRFRADSELSGLRDRAAAGAAVSPVLEYLVAVALDAARATGGLVDPTLGRAMREVGYDRDLRLVQDEDGRPVKAVTTRLPAWRRIRLADGRLTVPDGVELDLGATAKARTADAVADVAAAALGCGVLVNLGGDLATRGPAPAGGWQVTVQDLPGDPACQVSLGSGWGLATSSTRRRTWRRGGETMHHVLDPRTGRPAPPVWRSVSVAAPTAVAANTLTTAAIVDGARALALLQRHGRPARLVDAAGGVLRVCGWPDDRAEAA